MSNRRTTNTDYGATRRARTDARLTEVVRAHLKEYGYGGLTIERVSADSGVAKTTIYRRWSSKAEMVFDLAVHQPDSAIPRIDTGSLVGDVRTLTERAVVLVAHRPGRDILPGLLADMAGDEKLTKSLREKFVTPAHEEISSMLEKAVERGELEGRFDINNFHATLLGVPYAHIHLLGVTDKDLIVDQLTEQLLDLVKYTSRAG